MYNFGLGGTELLVYVDTIECNTKKKIEWFPKFGRMSISEQWRPPESGGKFDLNEGLKFIAYILYRIQDN